MTVPAGLATPHRILALIPVVLAFVFVVGSLGLAMTHLNAKGHSPYSGASQVAIATGQTQPERGAYTGRDFTEPNRQ